MPAMDRQTGSRGGGQAVLRVGIPRTLHYFYLGRRWEALLRGLGCEVVVSPPTDRVVFEKGASLSLRDICLPVKAFFGHVDWLDRRCDRIFVPRLVSVHPSRYYCPKFLALPDLAAAVAPPEKVLSVEINAKKAGGSAERAYAALGRMLGAGGDAIRAAIAAAAAAGSGGGAGESARGGAAAGSGSFRIAVLGHPYLTMDGFLSSGIAKWFSDRGARVILYDEIPADAASRAGNGLFREIYWESAFEIHRAGAAIVDSGLADGIAVLSAFGCGPDSFVSDLTARMAREAGLPVLSLMLDEHSSIVGVETRLEAFMDMIAMRLRRAGK